MFSLQRVRLDEKLASFREFVERHIPTFDQEAVSRVYHQVTHSIVHYCALAVLSIVRFVERKTVSVLEHIRGKRDIKRGVTSSDFLKQVNDHKQSLEKPSRNSVE
jgi:hypothetical protein